MTDKEPTMGTHFTIPKPEAMMCVSSRLFTIQQVVLQLQVADETIYRYIRSGKLRAVRCGGLWRVSEDALREFLETEVKRGDVHRSTVNS